MKLSRVSSPYLQQIVYYLKREKWLFLAGFMALLLSSASQLLPPLIVGHIIDNSIPNKDMADMLRYGLAFVAVILISGLLSFAQINILGKLGVKIITEFKRKVFQHLLKAPVSYFNEHPVGELIAKVESDSEQVRGLFSSTSIAILGNLLFFAGVYVVLLLRDSRITLILTPPILVITVSFFFLARLMSKVFKRVRELYAEITARITDYVQGMLVIQVLNRQQKVFDQLFGLSRSKKVLDTRINFMIYGVFNAYQFIFSVVFIIVIIRLSAPGIIAGISTIGTLFIFMQYINRLISPLIQLSFGIIEIQRSFVSLQRIMDLTVLETEEQIHPGTLKHSYEHEIRFEHVWFAYNREEWVLRDVSFTIPKGGKLGLVGPSGSGKSTVVSLLCCFYRPGKGCIYVDGIPLQEIDLFTWRRQIGLILQDIFVFPGNITENVRVYNDDIAESEVKQAIGIVQLDSFIDNLPQGMETELAERGQNISQGEKQLLSFARALAFSPDLIIMDEATASIDSVTEAKIQNTITKVLHNKTAVIVAHRLSSIVDADEILYFKEGQVHRRGNHSQLLDVCPEYRHMFELQDSQAQSAAPEEEVEDAG